MLKPLLFSVLGLSAQFAQAWQLDATHSDVSFTSIKAGSVAENHHFKQLTGSINKAGELDLRLDLSSIESLIPIRNERMQKMLFNVAKFPEAKITANVSQHLKALKPGAQIIRKVPVTLALHGQVATLNVDLVVNKGAQQLQVTPLRAVLINSRDFGLDVGIEALRKVAGLNTIATAVPVTFNLVFSE